MAQLLSWTGDTSQLDETGSSGFNNLAKSVVSQMSRIKALDSKVAIYEELEIHHSETPAP